MPACSHPIMGVVATFLAVSTAALAATGPDVTLCQLYDLQQFGREGDVVGLAAATTSLNVGDENLLWQAVPSELHPFIVTNLYRLHDDRFEQIGQSWVKHGFYATNASDCGTMCQDPGVGSLLGPGCTDTYDSSLNAYQPGLGPRFEINPYTGAWQYEGSHLETGNDNHSPIDHRMQVHDADLDTAIHEDAEYFLEGYYVTSDDVDPSNSIVHKSVTVSGAPGGTWLFEDGGEFFSPITGAAIYAWPGSTRIDISGVDDGRCILAYKVTSLDDGLWRYEYAVFNLNMDRAVASVSIPVPEGVTLTGIGFHDVDSHGEPFSNDDWVVTSGGGSVQWATEPEGSGLESNPIRWGTLYNFRFDADTPPIDRSLSLGLYKVGEPGELIVSAVAPSTPGDCNENGHADADELADGTAEDCNDNGYPDDCDPDCDANQEADECEIAGGMAPDCNGNQAPDHCDLEANDCNSDAIPDECELTDNDCNANAIPDDCDLSTLDCNGDGVVDTCDPEGAGPVLLTPPAGATICIGADYTFTVVAQGTDPILYFWFKNGQLLLGEESSSLTLTNVDLGDIGNYSVLVADGCDYVFSNGALLLVIDCPNAPQIVGVESWVQHGPLGELSIPMALDNNQGPAGFDPTTDSRLGAGGTITVLFDREMDPDSAQNTQNILLFDSDGDLIDPMAMSAVLTGGIELRITFPGLPDQRLPSIDRYMLDLSLLEDVDGATVGKGPDAVLEFRLLPGDVNGDGTVDPLDSGGVLARFGTDIAVQPGYDVNVDGLSIDPLDAGAVLARLGTSAP